MFTHLKRHESHAPNGGASRKALAFLRAAFLALAVAIAAVATPDSVSAAGYTYIYEDTIKGVTYSQGDTFTSSTSFKAYSSSDDDAVVSKTYTEAKSVKYWRTVYYDGELAQYPYHLSLSQYDMNSGFYTTLAAFNNGSVTVTFNGNNGTPSSKKVTYTYGTSGQTFPGSSFSRTGYTLSGWATSASGSSSYAANASVSDTFINNHAGESVTLYAVWKANTYTIKFDANGGSGAPSSQTKTYGVSLTLSDTVPTRTGYTFLGWSTSSTATTATYKAGGSYTANSAATLYAVWQAKTATVVFKANGGEGSDVTKTYTYDVSGQSFPGVIFTREGYTMAGWAKSASATSQDYLPSATPTNAYINSNAGTTVTLYAVWTPITYTLRFDANGGEGSMEDQEVSYGVSGQYVNLNEFTRAGYEFLGWNAYRTSDDKWFTTSGWYTKDEIDANGYEMFLYTDGVVVVKTCYIDGDVAIMYAQWNAQSYTVSFDANGGVGSMEDQVVNAGVETNLPACTFTKTDMMFAGWGLTADGDAVYSDGAAVTDITEPGGTVKLYAIWVKMAAFDTSSIYEDADMFTGCVNLEGGNGTTYSSNHTDSEYAKIDRDGIPGYFTKK